MNGKVRRVDLADLVIRGVAVDQLSRHLRRVEQGISISRRLTKTDVHRQDEVGIAKQCFHIAVHRHAGIADIGRTVIVYDVMEPEGGDDRYVIGCCEAFNLARAVLGPPRPAKKDDRFLGGGQATAACRR